MSERQSSLEKICLMGVEEKNLLPLFQIKISGCKLCISSYQQAPGEKGKSKPDCQYCSNIIVYIEKSDVLDGWYNKCKYWGEKK